MGVTIKCKKTGRSCDLGCGGFNRFRCKVANLCSEEFGKHYETLDAGLSLHGEARTRFYEDFDKETVRLIEEKKVNIKVADFCLQSDCEGKIRYGACKVIYESIKDYDDNVIYGYVGRPDRAMFRDLKAIIKDCIDTKSDLVWW